MSASRIVTSVTARQTSGARPAEQTLACLRCHILGASANPVQWWFLPGCGHVGGRAAVCDPCKQQIDAGNRVPRTYEGVCHCHAAPVLTLIGG